MVVESQHYIRCALWREELLRECVGLDFSYEYESGVGGHHEISLMTRLPLRGTNVLQVVH